MSTSEGTRRYCGDVSTTSQFNLLASRTQDGNIVAVWRHSRNEGRWSTLQYPKDPTDTRTRVIVLDRGLKRIAYMALMTKFQLWAVKPVMSLEEVEKTSPVNLMRERRNFERKSGGPMLWPIPISFRAYDVTPHSYDPILAIFAA